MDKIVQGNTSNIVFLKSTDDSMLDTLQKMSGTTHRSFTDSKTVTRDMEKIMMKNEGKTSYTMTTREVPVIAYNDMAFIAERNSIIFRAGDSPIWNRNETILPMSWRLFQNTITQPGKDYTLQTIPTLSTAIDFDVRKNQPDFAKMLDKRMKQAYVAEQTREVYKGAYGYSDYDIEQLDPDVYSDEIMDIINRYLREEADPEDELEFEFEDGKESWMDYVEENKEVEEAIAKKAAERSKKAEKKFAGCLLSIDDLVSGTPDDYIANHALDREIITAYTRVKGDMWQDIAHFTNRAGSLCGVDGTVYISKDDVSDDLKSLNTAAKEDSKVFSEDDVKTEELNSFGTYTVTDEFYGFLAFQRSWKGFAKGRFDDAMKKQLMG